jgi:hypothetical protein
MFVTIDDDPYGVLRYRRGPIIFFYLAPRADRYKYKLLNLFLKCYGLRKYTMLLVIDIMNHVAKFLAVYLKVLMKNTLALCYI